MKRVKNTISVLVVVLIILSILPTIAFATEVAESEVKVGMHIYFGQKNG